MKMMISLLLCAFSFQAHADALDQQLKAVNSFFGLKNGQNQNVQLRGTVGNVCWVHVSNNTKIVPGHEATTGAKRNVRISILTSDLNSENQISNFKLGMWSEKVEFKRTSETTLSVSSSNRDNPASYPVATTVKLKKLSRNTVSVQIINHTNGRSAICEVSH